MTAEAEAEKYFDKIYTYHANDYVRMPLNELYELMSGFAQHHHKAKVESIRDEEIDKLSKSFSNQFNQQIWESGAKWLKQKLLSDD